MITPSTRNNKNEIDSGERFAFGENWKNFLSVVSEQRIEEAELSLKEMLEVVDLKGKTFLDIGSGSGLFSLAAKRLGAKVMSFDYDPQSVACTKELKRRYFENDSDWRIEVGDVLNAEYLLGLGKFDIVYSWGVLHHTGSMWAALRNINLNVEKCGQLFIALYNYQPFASKYWTFVKKIYNKYPISRPLFVFVHAIYPTFPSIIIKLIQNSKYPRGMSIWYDLYDWLGGYPFEVSTPSEIFNFYKKNGYILKNLKTVGGRLGCNEYVFQLKS
jgi:2-polyprenyl-3-methyl-5-hydroxy-6-metoxy-1,4-benzoquinol methylase